MLQGSYKPPHLRLLDSILSVFILRYQSSKIILVVAQEVKKITLYKANTAAWKNEPIFSSGGAVPTRSSLRFESFVSDYDRS